MGPKPPKAGGVTAVWMAQRRAEESARPDRLFDDPLAAAFVQAAGSAAPPAWARAGAMQDYFAVRTRFIDDQLLAADADGCRQVVLLGAGLDARAFRLAWPDPATRLFELDVPDVLTFKADVLTELGAQPRCERIAVAADLRADWTAALAAAGLRADAPTVWLVEGLLMYLAQADADRLVDRIGACSAPGSRLVLEHRRFEMPTFSQALAAVPLELALAALGATWRSSVRDPVAWLGAHGWRATAPDAAEVARGYGRTIPPDARAWLVSAVRASVSSTT